MFAVIASSQYWKVISKTIKNIDEDIVYKSIDENIEVINELENVSRLPVRKLIIDFNMLKDEQKLVQAIRRLRIKKDNIQIIMIAPGFFPGNEILSSLVKMGVYDILNPSIEEIETIEDLLLKVIDKPTSYSRAVKWDIESIQNSNVQVNIKKDKSEKEKLEIIERTVTITKEKIIGTVIIGIAGTMTRIGTTHTSISIGKFLSKKQFKVAVVELFPSETFEKIKESYEEIESVGDYFKLSNICFFPYNESLSVTNILQRDFNYIILDMGIYKNCNIDEFNRSNKKIILSGVKDWELGELEVILKNIDNIYINKYNYLFNFSDTRTFEFVNKNMDNLSVFKAGFNPNPFELTKETQASFLKILKDVLPSENNSNTKGLFNIFKKIVKKVGV